jgi:hypothetical protein
MTNDRLYWATLIFLWCLFILVCIGWLPIYALALVPLCIVGVALRALIRQEWLLHPDPRLTTRPRCRYCPEREGLAWKNGDWVCGEC